jgi:multimeric flavodoxin WrbA
MKALILDGSTKDDKILEMVSEKLESRLAAKNWDVKTFVLRDMSIAPCLGCFGCWIKTPGICVIDDGGRNVARTASESDLWIFLTRVTFGGYSSHLKKAIDRLPPLFIPIFEVSKTDVHHKWRLKKRAKLAVIGCMDEADSGAEDIFTDLTKRNSFNFHSLKHACAILHRSQQDREIEIVMTELFGKMMYE